MIKTIIISAAVSYAISYLTAKKCLDRIDRYVESVISEARSVIEIFEKFIS